MLLIILDNNVVNATVCCQCNSLLSMLQFVVNATVCSQCNSLLSMQQFHVSVEPVIQEVFLTLIFQHNITGMFVVRFVI